MTLLLGMLVGFTPEHVNPFLLSHAHKKVTTLPRLTPNLQL